MTYDATRAARLSRIQRELDAIVNAIPDVETEAKYCRDPNEAFESLAYVELLDAIYALTEIEAVLEKAEEVRLMAEKADREQREADAAEFRLSCRDEERAA